MKTPRNILISWCFYVDIIHKFKALYMKMKSYIYTIKGNMVLNVEKVLYKFEI